MQKLKWYLRLMVNTALLFFYDRIFDKSSSCEVRGILAHLKSTRGCYTSQRHRNSSSLSLVIMIGWSSERGKHFLTLSTGRSGKKNNKKTVFFSRQLEAIWQSNSRKGIFFHSFSWVLGGGASSVGTVLCLCWHASMTNVNLASVVCYHHCPVKLRSFGSHSCRAAPSDSVVWLFL